ncbi:hypothetical protein GCM10027567_05960 [Spongiibacter taiwanensis]
MTGIHAGEATIASEITTTVTKDITAISVTVVMVIAAKIGAATVTRSLETAIEIIAFWVGMIAVVGMRVVGITGRIVSRTPIRGGG